MKFQKFRTREQWLNARADTLGASTLAGFMLTKKLPEPLPENVPALESALAFGSDWEPVIAKEYAKAEGLKAVRRNTPFDQLGVGELSWHDNSFYTADGLHCSYDAIARTGQHVYRVVEFKTGSPLHEWNIDKKLRARYHAQVEVERSFAKKITDDEVEADLVYVHRPRNWENMTPEEIGSHIKASFLPEGDKPSQAVTRIDDDNSEDGRVEWSVLVQFRRDFEEMQREFAKKVGGENAVFEQPYEGKVLLERYIGLQGELASAKEELLDWLKKHPETKKLRSLGKEAKLSTTTRTNTAWAKFLDAKGYSVDGLDEFQTTSVSEGISITKEKK